MDKTNKGNRLHIGIFGRCNAGKSTLTNLLAAQEISITSPMSGTTTDPVQKGMEILPIGPVMLVDTAGIDDSSELGQLRINKTKKLLSDMDAAIYVIEEEAVFDELDREWIQLLKDKSIPTILFINLKRKQNQNALLRKRVVNKIREVLGGDKSIPIISADLMLLETREYLLDALVKAIPPIKERSLLDGVIEKGSFVLLVCPIDDSAPKGRIILPQVQVIREILDKGGMALVMQVEELKTYFLKQNSPPDLVITDSQVFKEVDQIVPNSIPLTSFSILMARFKGDLPTLMSGIKALRGLKKGSKILISEGCTHRQQCEDIGTVKIPRWLKENGFEDLDFTWSSGGSFPENIEEFDLIIHCGACMLTRREVLNRVNAATYKGVPIVNYGILIAALHGILERTVSPFEEELI